MNRSDLMEQVGQSVNQASADLNRYIGLAPDNVVYDKSARTYVCAPKYSAFFLEPDANRYFAQIRSLTDGLMDSDDSWIAELPAYDAAPTPDLGVNPITLRSVVGAIRRSEAIVVKYQSLSPPDPSWRWIAHHAIGLDGFRWHTRAFCKIDEVFKDFMLLRILQTRVVEADGSTDAADADREEHVTLEIAPTLNSPRTRRK